LQIFLSVEQRSPKYKDSQQRIQEIEQEQRIINLVESIKTTYVQENWTGVVALHEELKTIDPFLKLPELDEMLFISYRQLIIQTAGQANASLEEIELAEKYYRTALSLVPQSREFVAERQELQEIASSLLANKYFLYGMSLLETSNYSINSMREAVRLLNKASGISSGSPLIRAEIDKAQLFIDSYDSFVRQRWTTAIDGFEELYRKDNSYANGMLKYLLFEAYLARGDDFLAFSDFEKALLDYQEAEKYAWGSENNLVYLFKAELRIAYTLRRLWREDDAAEFYRFAFDHIGYQNLLTQPDQADLLATLNQARSAFQSGSKWDAIRLYESALENESLLYQYTSIKVSRGDSLAQIAFLYGTTIENLRTANRLGESMTIVSEQEIQVPLFTSPQE
jgi:tetratricopeptide (TPR) repeat protein